LTISRAEKEALIDRYVERLRQSQAVILSDYRGLNTQEMEKLRGALRERGVSVHVVKNTLWKLALQRLEWDVPEKELVGPIAVSHLPEDIGTAAKAVLDLAREFEPFVIKGGILEGKALDAEGAKALANLPSRETLRARLLGVVQGPAFELTRTLQAPMSDLANVIAGPMRELVFVLYARGQQQA